MRDDLVYLKDIINAINDIEEFIIGMDQKQFLSDKKTIQACIRELEIIGEAVKNISSDIIESYPQIQWKAIAGMRDKLIHGYFGVKINLVWKTITEDIPFLKTEIIKIIDIKEK
ncbi:MAG: DUF86 domain-containing protein [Leptospiraceae bacterium]|nr:DUF86 domain-containing protein [Leptospiraceae bacterium]